MASAQKCGGCQKNTTPNNPAAAHERVPVAAAQAMSTGAAPQAPPHRVDWEVCRLEQQGVDEDVIEDRPEREGSGQQVRGQGEQATETGR